MLYTSAATRGDNVGGGYVLDEDYNEFRRKDMEAGALMAGASTSFCCITPLYTLTIGTTGLIWMTLRISGKRDAM